MQTSTQSVVIVGGGHVGLSLALMLSHVGIRSTLIEKTRYPTTTAQNNPHLDIRNTALSRKTVQIYQQIGIWQDLQSHACRIDKVHIYEQLGFGHATLDKQQEKVESFGQVIENAHLGHILLTQARQSPFITLIDDTSVSSLSHHGDIVSVTLGNQQCICGNLLVACDGQHSKIRTLLGIDTDRYDYKQAAIVAAVTTDKPHNHTAIECFSPLGPLALLPLTDHDSTGYQSHQNGHRRSVVFICPLGQENQYVHDDGYFLRALNDTFGDIAGNISQTGKRGVYPLTKVLAKQQTKQRVIIMGNAAHTLHPVAGQGFNLCIRDAFCLATKLHLAQQQGDDFANQALLDEYQSTRLSDQKRVILFCDTIVHTFKSTNPLLKLLRNVGLILFDKIPYIKPMVARFAMGLKSVD